MFHLGGINDIGIGIPLDRTFRNYQSIVDTLLRHKIDLVLQITFYVNYPNDSTTNFINSRVDSLNIYLSGLANRNGIGYVNINYLLSENSRLKKEYSRDGLHINDLGYKVWVREVKRILRSKGL